MSSSLEPVWPACVPQPRPNRPGAVWSSRSAVDRGDGPGRWSATDSPRHGSSRPVPAWRRHAGARRTRGGPEGGSPPLTHLAPAGGRLHILPTGPGSPLRSGAIDARSKVQLARLLGTRPVDARKARLPVGDRMACRSQAPSDAESVDLGPPSEHLCVRLRSVQRRRRPLPTADRRLRRGSLPPPRLGAADRCAVRVARHPYRAEVTGLDRVVAGWRSGRPGKPGVAEGGGGDRGPARGSTAPPGRPRLGLLEPPVTAACLDLGVRNIPTPGYIVSFDDPMYATVQSPPAPGPRRTRGRGRHPLRRPSGEQDRPELERLVARAGVGPDDIITRRFLARHDGGRCHAPSG